MRDELARWKNVRKLESQEAPGRRRISVKVNAGESGPDPNKEPC